MAANLYYGNGECTIEGTEIRGVEIRYSGSIYIKKTANDNFALISNDSGIIIFPIGEGFLNNLFTYKGNLKINSTIVANNSDESVKCTINRVMDYAELIKTNAEDMTIVSENLTSGYDSPPISKTINLLDPPDDGIIKDQYSKGEFYLEDGSLYTGAYHIHLKDSNCMTGCEHMEDSQDLYFKQIVQGVIINNLIPTKNPNFSLPANDLISKKVRRKKNTYDLMPKKARRKKKP